MGCHRVLRWAPRTHEGFGFRVGRGRRLSGIKKARQAVRKRLAAYERQRCCAWNGRTSISSRGFITVAAHKSKTARRRLIPIAHNLSEWLRPYAQMSGQVYSARTRTYHADIDALRTFISLPTWPNNGLRHSFASYHLAFHQDAAALMLQMGHTTTREILRPIASSSGRTRLKNIGISDQSSLPPPSFQL
jgi:integrase